MLKKTLGIIILFLIAIPLLAETKIVPLREIQKPSYMVFDNTQMYIVEGTTIYIYSLKDFKLIKKFGKQGEGPEEFMLHPQMLGNVFPDVTSNEIIVSSFGKVSYFSKEGVYKKEMKLPNPFIFGIRPFGKYYLAVGLSVTGEMWQLLNVYNHEFVLQKEITRAKHSYQQGKGLVVLESKPEQEMYKGKLYVAWTNELLVRVFDENLKELPSITHQVERLKVTEDDKTKIIDYLKTSPETKPIFPFLQPIRFPEYYPAIQSLLISNEVIHIFTFYTERKGDIQSYEILLFSLEGKFLGKIMLPVKMSTPLAPYPLNLHDGKIFQLVENIETEEWHLHMTGYKISSKTQEKQ